MAYRRPAVTVIQEFVGLVPALAAFNLPTVVVGPAYQLVDNDLLGTYSGTLQVYAYASLMGGAQVDLEELSEDELFPATKKPISVVLKDAEVEIVPTQLDGAASGTVLTDNDAGQFDDVAAGDIIVVEAQLGIAILAPQTNGVTSDAVGQRNRLTAGTAGQFSQVKIGDTVDVTGGTNTNVAQFAVLSKPSNDLLILDADVNDGGGPSTDVAYSISGDRGVANAGDYRVRSKTSGTELVTESPFVEAESPVKYSIKREVAEIELPRDLAGFSATEAGISLPAGLMYVVGTSSFEILAGSVYGNYRGLRNDMAANVREFARLSDLQAFFGVTQITPQNPLAYGLSVQLQNTVTPINGLGLNGDAVEDETLSYQNACDVLALTEMYAIVPLTQNPAIHQVLKGHVEGMSQPENKKERVGIVNRLLKTVETLKDESTTSGDIVGARIIVNTQVDGSGALASPSVVNDATADQFLNVNPGDSLVVVGGTNANAGTYPVASKQSSNQLTVTGSIFTGTCTDLQYYIVRKDGVSANGTTFYDRSATFISDGIAPGMYVKMSGPSGVLGRHRITNVTSEKELEVEQIPGVVALVTGITYLVERDLSKTEQADFLKGYSTSLASRRMVNVWPDIVKAPVGQTLQDLPGYYAGCAVGAMTTGLPTQQGFTNLSISGFLGLEHSTGYFTDAQLDIIADGGTFIFGQAGDESPLFIRHQLTTDRSAIKFQEFSVTKNVDFIAKFLRQTYAPFIGVYNIIDSTMDELRGTAKAVLTFLKDDTRLPRIGGVIRNGSLSLLEEHPTQIDTVRMRFKLDIPIPLNNLDITIEV